MITIPRPNLSTTQRGYGWPHQQARADALRLLKDGTPCARCHRPMYRSQSRLLDLDHSDDRTAYRGLAHRRCNRQAGQAKAAANRARRTRSTTRTRSSRTW